MKTARKSTASVDRAKNGEIVRERQDWFIVKCPECGKEMLWPKALEQSKIRDGVRQKYMEKLDRSPCANCRRPLYLTFTIDKKTHKAKIDKESRYDF